MACLHVGHGRGQKRRHRHHVRPVSDGLDELLRRDVHAQVDDLIARALQHHRHEVLAYVVQVPLGGADRHLAAGGHTLLHQVGLEHRQRRCHGPGGHQHLGHEDLAFLVELAHLGHARDQTSRSKRPRFDAV
jgi:hypothetical protein